jgi:hypothetical protein
VLSCHVKLMPSCRHARDDALPKHVDDTVLLDEVLSDADSTEEMPAGTLGVFWGSLAQER